MWLRLAALALTTTAATAAPSDEMTPEDKSALTQQCSGDFTTFCGDLDPDGPEVQACFKRNISKLSPGCQAAINRYSKAQKKG